jgi:hypothetical protein
MPSISSGIKWLIHGESTIPNSTVPIIESILIDDNIRKSLTNDDNSNNKCESKIDNNDNIDYNDNINYKKDIKDEIFLKSQHQVLTDEIKQRTEERFVSSCSNYSFILHLLQLT